MTFNVRTDAATPPPPIVPPPPPVERQHVVKPNESIAQIAGDNHTTPQAVLQVNPQVRDPALIRPGDTLNLPPPTVSREVSTTVDAVLTKDATPAQRDTANEQVQDYVDQVGGVSDQGITPEALPAQAQRMLGEAGLPVIPGEVIASVDQALGPQASLEQRTAGYGTVQQYVDQVGGVGDAGIVADALPAKAAELLRADGAPVALRSEVITAVDGVLAPDASSADRQAAYSTVQQYVDQVGGVGDAGIVADHLPAKAAQLLVDSGNAGLRFDPQVVQAVDQVSAPGAFDVDRLKGYEAVQSYVDDVGGVGDQGITADYLPVRAAELMRAQGIALNTAVVDNASADQIVVASQGGATPAEQARVLSDGYAAATPAVQQQVLADPRALGVLRAASAEAMQPLSQSPESFGGGEAVPALKAMDALDAATDGLHPDLAAAVLDASVPAMVAYRGTDTGGAIGPDGMAAFLRVTDRVAGTPAGDAAIQRVAGEVGFFDQNATLQHIAAGGSPAYSLALGSWQNEAVSGVQGFAAGPVADSITAYTEHTAELNWLVANHGPSMTPEQLNAAVSDYIASKGPEWSAKGDELKNAVADSGLKLKTQIEALQAAGGNEATIQQLLDDPNNQFALSTGLGAHPEAATEQSLRSFAILAKASDGGRKVLGMVADAHIKAQLTPALAGYNPADPASVQRVETALARLQTGPMADALGVDQTKLTTAVSSLEDALRTSGSATTPAQFDAAMTRLNGDLDRLGLAKDTGAGQLFRGVGLGLASVGFAYSLEKLGQDPSSALAQAKVAADGIGLAQKTSEIMFGRGVGGSVAEFGAGKLAAGIAGGLGAAVDGAFAIRSFAEGDPASGALYTLAAGGGTLAAASSAGLVGAWGGPVGIGIAVVAAVGLGLVSQVKESNKYMTDTSQQFLEHAGLSPDASRALVDQSGEGHSPVALLAQYAELKGYDLKNTPQHQQQFATWLNGMSGEQLDHVRDWIHNASDEFDGDVGKLGTDGTVVLSQGMVQTAVVMDTPRTVGQIDAMMQEYGATPLPTA